MAQHDSESQGRKPSGDIQARQSDDGSFEIVVDGAGDGAGAAVASPEASAATESGGLPRWKIIAGLVVVATAVAVVVIALSGEEAAEDAATTAEASPGGFAPFEEELTPVDDGATAGRREATGAAARPVPAAEASDEVEGEAEAWALEEQAETDIIVIEDRVEEDAPEPQRIEGEDRDRMKDGHLRFKPESARDALRRLEQIRGKPLSPSVEIGIDPSKLDSIRINPRALDAVKPPVANDLGAEPPFEEGEQVFEDGEPVYEDGEPVYEDETVYQEAEPVYDEELREEGGSGEVYDEEYVE